MVAVAVAVVVAVAVGVAVGVAVAVGYYIMPGKKKPSPSAELKREIMDYALEHSGIEASIKYRYDRSTISRWLREEGKAKGKGKYTEEWWQEVSEWMGVIPDADIAIKFDCAKSTVGNRRRAMGIQSLIPARQGACYKDPLSERIRHQECQSALSAWTRPEGVGELLEEICALSMVG